MLMTLTLVLAGFSAGAVEVEGGPLRLHPENPRYFLFRGAPTFLINSGEH